MSSRRISPSTVHRPPFTVHCPPSTVLSVHRPLPSTRCQLSIVCPLCCFRALPVIHRLHRLLSSPRATSNQPPSTIHRPSSAAHRPLCTTHRLLLVWVGGQLFRSPLDPPVMVDQAAPPPRPSLPPPPSPAGTGRKLPVMGPKAGK